MLFMNCLTLFFGIMRVVNFMMENSWMAPLTPVVMVMKGLTFQPFVLSLLLMIVCVVLLFDDWFRASIVPICE